MNDIFARLVDTADFPARWRCGNWSDERGWLHIVSDSLIFLAYFAIPATLFVLIRRKRVSFPFILWLLIAFILSCGLTHLIDAAMFWWPAYRLSGLMKAITAGVSVATALSLIAILPKILELPSIAKVNAELQDALAREQSVRKKLELARNELETKSGELVSKDYITRQLLSGAAACGVRWDARTGNVLTEIAYPQLRQRFPDLLPPRIERWSDLIGDRQAEELARVSTEASRNRDWIHRRYELRGFEGQWDLRVTANAVVGDDGTFSVLAGLLGLVRYGDSIGQPMSPPPPA